MRPFIIDANIIIYFYCDLERPDILMKVCGDDAAVSESVKREVEYHAGEPGKSDFLADISGGYLRTIDVGPAEENIAAGFGQAFLHKGERDCAAIAVTRMYDMLTNDRMARETLMGNGITIHNAAWVLKEANKRRIITAAEYNRLSKPGRY
jgi:predicted nucleic acid-binding protein